MDNSVLSFQEALKQQESGGNYDATNGDSGAFGAYQFMPETWNDWATKAGADPNDRSPQNQDYVANFAISQLYKQYGDFRNVASVWYSGQPDYMVNSDEGDSPTVNGYVQSVMNRMGQGQFQYQAKDAQGEPFLNLSAYLRTSNPNEPFNYQGIMSLLQSKAPEINESIKSQYRNGTDYMQLARSQNPYVAELMMPYSEKLMANRLAEYQDNAARQVLQDNLKRGTEAINLINSSNNVDNKSMYAGLMKQVGIDVPSNVDQYVSGPQLVKNALEQVKADQQYNLAEQQGQNKIKQMQGQIGLLQDELEHTNKMASFYGI